MPSPKDISDDSFPPSPPIEALRTPCLRFPTPGTLCPGNLLRPQTLFRSLGFRGVGV